MRQSSTKHKKATPFVEFLHVAVLIVCALSWRLAQIDSELVPEKSALPWQNRRPPYLLARSRRMLLRPPGTNTLALLARSNRQGCEASHERIAKTAPAEMGRNAQLRLVDATSQTSFDEKFFLAVFVFSVSAARPGARIVKSLVARYRYLRWSTHRLLSVFVSRND